MYCIAENTVHSTDTYSSVVTGWNADQKDAGSILFSFILYVFISNQRDIGSNPVNSKSVNSVSTNNKILHLSSLLQNN